jgi:hypothetical protein
LCLLLTIHYRLSIVNDMEESMKKQVIRAGLVLIDKAASDECVRALQAIVKGGK